MLIGQFCSSFPCSRSCISYFDSKRRWRPHCLGSTECGSGQRNQVSRNNQTLILLEMQEISVLTMSSSQHMSMRLWAGGKCIHTSFKLRTLLGTKSLPYIWSSFLSIFICCNFLWLFHSPASLHTSFIIEIIFKLKNVIGVRCSGCAGVKLTVFSEQVNILLLFVAASAFDLSNHSYQTCIRLSNWNW